MGEASGLFILFAGAGPGPEWKWVGWGPWGGEGPANKGYIQGLHWSRGEENGKLQSVGAASLGKAAGAL